MTARGPSKTPHESLRAQKVAHAPCGGIPATRARAKNAKGLYTHARSALYLINASILFARGLRDAVSLCGSRVCVLRTGRARIANFKKASCFSRGGRERVVFEHRRVGSGGGVQVYSDFFFVVCPVNGLCLLSVGCFLFWFLFWASR